MPKTKIVKCEHCGYHLSVHQADTLACPVDDPHKPIYDRIRKFSKKYTYKQEAGDES